MSDSSELGPIDPQVPFPSAKAMGPATQFSVT